MSMKPRPSISRLGTAGPLTPPSANAPQPGGWDADELIAEEAPTTTGNQALAANESADDEDDDEGAFTSD
ncbi:MAG: hypothetical protein B7Z55_18305, partial [Planctomycetales bacterium 12-60-4]